jgi:hypothetical protein
VEVIWVKKTTAQQQGAKEASHSYAKSKVPSAIEMVEVNKGREEHGVTAVWEVKPLSQPGGMCCSHPLNKGMRGEQRQPSNKVLQHDKI